MMIKLYYLNERILALNKHEDRGDCKMTVPGVIILGREIRLLNMTPEQYSPTFPCCASSCLCLYRIIGVLSHHIDNPLT